jgi:predicted nucleic acid-binding protein
MAESIAAHLLCKASFQNVNELETIMELGIKRSSSTIDALLAATAKVNGMTLATRNISDVANLGVRVLDPFERQA